MKKWRNPQKIVYNVDNLISKLWIIVFFLGFKQVIHKNVDKNVNTYRRDPHWNFLYCGRIEKSFLQVFNSLFRRYPQVTHILWITWRSCGFYAKKIERWRAQSLSEVLFIHSDRNLPFCQRCTKRFSIKYLQITNGVLHKLS